MQIQEAATANRKFFAAGVFGRAPQLCRGCLPSKLRRQLRRRPAPTLTIARGRAEFPWQGCMLGGNVSPSGNDDDLQALARCSRDRSIASIKSLARGPGTAPMI